MNFRDWLFEQDLGPQIRNKKILIIMRGIPGSGKSTQARILLYKLGGNPDGHIISTDNFWIPETKARRKKGETVSEEEEMKEYKKNYDPSLLQKAHVNTHIEFKRAVDQGVTPLIVDNTNIRTQEMRPYADYAEQRGYEIKIEYPNSKWWNQYYPFMADKRKNSDKLLKFANELTDRQKKTHGVPFEAIMKMIDNWDHAPTLTDILGREPTPMNKFK